ncbi:hypothetical protein H4R19_004586, partial [Coemansia spiralis]
IVDESGDDYYGQFFRGTGVKEAPAPKALSAERADPPKQRTARELSSTAAEPKSASKQPKGPAPAPGTTATMAMHQEGSSVSGAAGPAGIAAAAIAACVAVAL